MHFGADAARQQEREQPEDGHSRRDEDGPQAKQAALAHDLFERLPSSLALFLSRQNLSVPAAVGFLAVFGVAMLNGVVLVAYFRQLQAGGKQIGRASCRERV